MATSNLLGGMGHLSVSSAAQVTSGCQGQVCRIAAAPLWQLSGVPSWVQRNLGTSSCPCDHTASPAECPAPRPNVCRGSAPGRQLPGSCGEAPAAEAGCAPGQPAVPVPVPALGCSKCRHARTGCKKCRADRDTSVQVRAGWGLLCRLACAGGAAAFGQAPASCQIMLLVLRAPQWRRSGCCRHPTLGACGDAEWRLSGLFSQVCEAGTDSLLCLWLQANRIMAASRRQSAPAAGAARDSSADPEAAALPAHKRGRPPKRSSVGVPATEHPPREVQAAPEGPCSHRQPGGTGGAAAQPAVQANLEAEEGTATFAGMTFLSSGFIGADTERRRLSALVQLHGGELADEPALCQVGCWQCGAA